MSYLAYAPDAVLVALAAVALVIFVRPRPSVWWLRAAGIVLTVTLAAWLYSPDVSAVAKLSVPIIAFWILPGFLVLEWLFPRLARTLDAFERAPLLFGLSLSVWAVIGIVVFRTEPRTDYVIAGFLALEVLGVVLLARARSFRHAAGATAEPATTEATAPGATPFLIALVGVILLVAVLVGITAPFQSPRVDSSLHLAGYSKIALNDRVLAVNPYLGPGASYLLHYLTNPGYLAYGLTARVAHAEVTWLYVYLAALLTPLFFLAMYSLVNAVVANRWVAAIAALLSIGPYIAAQAISWAPIGGFYLMFLSFPGTYVQLIVFPLWLSHAVRNLRLRDDTWAFLVVLSVGAMASHPEALMVVPYCMGLLMLVSFWFGPAAHRRHSAAAFAAIVALMSVFGYLLFHPPGMSSWTLEGIKLEPEGYMKALLDGAWIISPNLYAIHPLHVLRSYYWFFAAAGVLTAFVLIRPLRSLLRPVEETDGPAVDRAPAVAIVVLAVAPFLLVCNPLLVPLITELVGPTPVGRVPGQFEVFTIACQWGAVAALLWAATRRLNVRWLTMPAKSIVAFAVVAAMLIFPISRPRAAALFRGMVQPRGSGIIGHSSDPFYQSLARLDRGTIAIEMDRAEAVLMTSRHYVMSSSWMILQRQKDNDTIVRFDTTPDRMRVLLDQYGVTYVVVRTDANANELANGDFSKGGDHWDATSASSIAGIPGGVHERALQLTPKGEGHASQLTYQNVAVRAGADYRLEAWVKSGTSGDEPFAVQIFNNNVGGAAPRAAIEGRSTAEWAKYTTSFTAPERELSVVLRKASSSPGTMLFDQVSLTEEAGAIRRFSSHPEMFTVRLSTPDQVVFEVKRP